VLRPARGHFADDARRRIRRSNAQLVRTGAELERQGVIDAAILTEIRWCELFGKVIANGDMHFGNLSLFVKGSASPVLRPPTTCCR
jgi:hypothetical protein